MKDQSFQWRLTTLILCLLAVEPAFATVGGSFYANQLSSVGAGNTSYGNIGGSSAGYTVGSSLLTAIDLQAGDWNHSMAYMYTTTDQQSIMEWDLPSGTFNASTVIAFRNTLYPGFSSGSPWHLEVSNGPTWQAISGVSGAGANGDGTIAMGNSTLTAGTKIRVVFNNLNGTSPGPNYFASMGEILVLPDKLQTVTSSYTASASSQYFVGSDGPSNAIDNHMGNNNMWSSAAGDSHAWFTLSFTSPTTLNALLLSSWDDQGAGYTDAIADIYVNGTLAGGWTDGTLVASGVDLSSPSSYASFNVFKFDSTLTGVNSLSLKFTNSGRVDGAQGLSEITPLEFVPIPEPSSVLLFALGGGLLLRAFVRRKLQASLKAS